MSDYRVAARYAKSLLELAEEQGVLKEVHDDMKMFHTLCLESREFVQMLKNPIIRHDKKRIILQKIFDKKVNKLTLAIFDIITRKNREPILPSIAKEFINLYNIFNGIEVATITTVSPLTKELRGKIEDIVKKISPKPNVQLVEKINKDLIGGFILKVGDRQIDDSIKSKLKALELEFSHNPYIKEF